jgi:hypothetical protein
MTIIPVTLYPHYIIYFKLFIFRELRNYKRSLFKYLSKKLNKLKKIYLIILNKYLIININLFKYILKLFL